MSIFLEKEILESLDKVSNDLRKFTNAKKVLFQEKDNCLLKTSFQNIFNIKYKDPLFSSIHRLMIEHCLLAEKISPGGFDLTLHKILSNDHCDHYVEKSANFATINDLKNLIQKQTEDSNVSSLLFESIVLSGFGGRISVEKSNNDITSTEVIDGFTFKVKIFEEKPVKITKPKILVIDGYIESVSEINLLLESVYSTKYPLVLITRGFHDDVLNTIKVNRTRGTIEVYPVMVEFNLEGINKLNDISIASSSSLISSNLGQLISNLTIEDANIVDEISIYANSICIKNPNSRNVVNSHIKFLLEKREESKNVEEVYEERIRSLSSNNVIIRLPDSKDYVVKRQIIDYCLRSIKSIIEFGILDNGELYASHTASKKFSKLFFEKIKMIGAIVCNST